MKLSGLKPAERHRRIAATFTDRVQGTKNWDAAFLPAQPPPSTRLPGSRMLGNDTTSPPPAFAMRSSAPFSAVRARP